MASKKEIKSKKVAVKKTGKTAPKAVVQDIEEKDDDRKPLKIDVADILPEADEKIEDESTTLNLEDEESEDGPSLDAEDLNPFGDKWEI